MTAARSSTTPLAGARGLADRRTARSSPSTAELELPRRPPERRAVVPAEPLGLHRVRLERGRELRVRRRTAHGLRRRARVRRRLATRASPCDPRRRRVVVHYAPERLAQCAGSTGGHAAWGVTRLLAGRRRRGAHADGHARARRRARTQPIRRSPCRAAATSRCGSRRRASGAATPTTRLRRELSRRDRVAAVARAARAPAHRARAHTPSRNPRVSPSENSCEPAHAVHLARAMGRPRSIPADSRFPPREWTIHGGGHGRPARSRAQRGARRRRRRATRRSCDLRPRHPRRRRQRHEPGRDRGRARAARPQARARALRRRGARAAARAGLRADHPRRRDARHGRLRDRAARPLARAQPRDADHLHHRPVVAGRRDPQAATSSARSTS